MTDFIAGLALVVALWSLISNYMSNKSNHHFINKNHLSNEIKAYRYLALDFWESDSQPSNYEYLNNQMIRKYTDIIALINKSFREQDLLTTKILDFKKLADIDSDTLIERKKRISQIESSYIALTQFIDNTKCNYY